VKVLFVTVGYPTEHDPVGGIFVREHALAAAEHAEISVLHLARGEPCGVRRVEGEPLPTWRSGFAIRPAAAGLLAAGLRGLHAAPHHDVVHAHFFLAALPCAVRRARPLVVTEHWSVFLPEDPHSLSPPQRSAARFAFRRADAVLAVSEALRRGLESHGVRRPIRVVPNPVDTTLFTLGAARRNGRLLSVGLLYEAKGYEYLLQAMALLAQQGHDLALDVVGDGPERERYERLALDLDVDKRVSFHGSLSKPEVARLMADSSLFVLASRYDNNPVALIEAMASGLPVVATAVGGVPELVDADTGRLAAPCDADSLATEIAAALDNLDGYDSAAIARRAAERFGRDAIGRQLAEVYEAVAR
jgi:glycosyltransferase involved in cell wall biosynthesis